MAIQLKTIHPYTFLGQVRNDLILVYAENDKGVRYNIKKVKTEEDIFEPTECAASLETYPLSVEYEVTNHKTENPQPFE